MYQTHNTHLNALNATNTKHGLKGCIGQKRSSNVHEKITYYTYYLTLVDICQVERQRDINHVFLT